MIEVATGFGRKRRGFAAPERGKAASLHKEGRGGFTIIESLVAGIILAIFAAAIAGAVARSSQAAARADDRRLAAGWLDEVFTRIDVIGPATLATEGPVDGELDERFSWSAAFTQVDAPPDLYDVAVTIRYTTPSGSTAAVRGYTRLYDPPGLRAATVTWEGLSE